MATDVHHTRRLLNLGAKPEWAQVWHIWTVLMPRRTITGRLVWGQVLRRYDGRRWIYKSAPPHV